MKPSVRRVGRSFGVAVLTLAVLLFGFQLQQSAASAATQLAPQPPADQKQIQAHFDGWDYHAVADGGQLNVIVNYDRLRPEGVNAFAQANRKLASQVQGSTSVTGVFRRPLAVQEFEGLVKQTGLQVTSYTLRAVDTKGGRITIQGAPLKTELVPQSLLKATLANVQQRLPGAVLKGIVTVDASATQAQLKQLLADQRVFTTEVATAVAADRARATLASQGVDVSRLTVHSRLAAPLFWFMENTGLVTK